MTYPTKAAQKRALDDLNAQYSKQRRVSMDWILTQAKDMGQTAVDEMYYGFPSDLHLVKDVHLEALPVDQANAIRGLVVARSYVKEQGVAYKAPSKAEATEQRVLRVLWENPQLTEVFQGDVKASITRDLEDSMVRHAGFLLVKYGTQPDFEALIKAAGPNARAGLLQDRANYAGLTNGDGLIMMDRIRKAAAEEAQAEVDNILPKMALKLGRTRVTHAEAGLTGRVEIKGELGGKKIHLIQTRVLKTSPLGKHFFQYPATLYVDHKRIPEVEFARMADAS